MGINYFNHKNVLGTIILGFDNIGEESITERAFDPYVDYQKGPFPSGKITQTVYLNSLIHWWISPFISIFSKVSLNSINNETSIEKNLTINLGIDAYWSIFEP